MSRINGTITVQGNRIIFQPDVPMREGAHIFVLSTTEIQSVTANHLYHEDLFTFTIESGTGVYVDVDKKDIYINTFDATTVVSSDTYDDIKFFWRGTGTIDPEPFYVESINPLDDSTGVATNTSVEITFNKAYDKSTAIGDNIYMEYEEIIPPTPDVLLWWRADNDGSIPIIEEPEDSNPLDFVPAYFPDTPSDFADSDHQMIGNGCLVLAPPLNDVVSVALLTESVLTSQGSIGFYLYMEARDPEVPEETGYFQLLVSNETFSNAFMLDVGSVEGFPHRMVITQNDDGVPSSIGYCNVSAYLNQYIFVQIVYGLEGNDWSVSFNSVPLSFTDKLALDIDLSALNTIQFSTQRSAPS